MVTVSFSCTCSWNEPDIFWNHSLHSNTAANVSLFQKVGRLIRVSCAFYTLFCMTRVSIVYYWYTVNGLAKNISIKKRKCWVTDNGGKKFYMQIIKTVMHSWLWWQIKYACWFLKGRKNAFHIICSSKILILSTTLVPKYRYYFQVLFLSQVDMHHCFGFLICPTFIKQFNSCR